MTTLVCPLPSRRPDLLFRPLGDDGQHVVKDPHTGAYFKLPPEEAFLFLLLDGRHTTAQLRAAFERRFGERLTVEDLDQFLSLARELGFLSEPDLDVAPAQPEAEADAVSEEEEEPAPVKAAEPAPARPAPGEANKRRGQSLLFWRASVFDPDRLFARLEPGLRAPVRRCLRPVGPRPPGPAWAHRLSSVPVQADGMRGGKT